MRFLYLNETGRYSLTNDLNGDRIPKYAILSHTWGADADEVTFEDMMNGTGEHKPGYKKISLCGEQTRKDGLKYFWVDTCCIDKQSSAVLSESINSMYAWYKNSKICYAYIDDWPSELNWEDLATISPDEMLSSSSVSSSDDSEYDEQPVPVSTEANGVRQSQEVTSPRNLLCRWFTRGWTLQELIAPHNLEFFDSSWTSRGTKLDQTVANNLSRITGITLSVLSSSNSERILRNICFGQRMSWAAYRVASRLEDIAYSLLGIFQINMPLLYGEGGHAFLRLQEEILKSSTDMSLLAWTQPRDDPQIYRGIFSRHPREFRGLRDCELDRSQFLVQDEVLMTNKGVRIVTSLFSRRDRHPDVDQILYLRCHKLDEHYQIGIRVKYLQGSFVREKPQSLARLESWMRTRDEPQKIYLLRNIEEGDPILTSYENERLGIGIQVRTKFPRNYQLRIPESWPNGYYDCETQTFSLGNHDEFVGYLLCYLEETKSSPTAISSEKVAALFTIVIKVDGLGKLSASLLNDVRFKQLKDHLTFISRREPFSAQASLFRMEMELREERDPLELDIPINDSLLQLRGTIYCEKCVNHNEEISSKGVEIAINVSGK